MSRYSAKPRGSKPTSPTMPSKFLGLRRKGTDLEKTGAGLGGGGGGVAGVAGGAAAAAGAALGAAAGAPSACMRTDAFMGVGT